jgi:HD-GYP domain-containing protein (c-di-GMP phosphodiesterase class II)
MVELIDQRQTCDERTFPGHAAPVEPALQAMLQYSELIDLPMMCVDVETGLPVAKSEHEVVPFVPPEVRQRLQTVNDVSIFDLPSGLLFFVVPLPDLGGSPMAGVGYVFSRAHARPHDLILAAAENNWSQTRLNAWLASQEVYCPGILERLLRLAVGQAQAENQAVQLECEIDQLSDHIDLNLEEISLLHALAWNLQISRTSVELAQLSLERMHGFVQAEGTAIWLEESHGETHFLHTGEFTFDEFALARLIARFEGQDWSQPVIRNRLEGTLLGSDFPGLKNLIVVSIFEGPHRYGWIVSCNRHGRRDFGTVEASLLSSVATILGTHNCNIGLYKQHADLLLSFVRSFVSTLDAKDAYTRGHSERVALIARRLGQELGLPEDELQDIYLAGLLHDIGKIGIDDRILSKPEQLTDDEFRKIQEHPMIGYTILSGLKNLNRVLPGVRNHHEAYNGKGYPDGLKGTDIPLMARILSVADSYDAMGSDRPYREGMPLETIEQIFRRGAGEQWDERIIDAYFRARDDIRTICAGYTLADGNLLKVESDE